MPDAALRVILDEGVAPTAEVTAELADRLGSRAVDIVALASDHPGMPSRRGGIGAEDRATGAAGRADVSCLCLFFAIKKQPPTLHNENVRFVQIGSDGF